MASNKRPNEGTEIDGDETPKVTPIKKTTSKKKGPAIAAGKKLLEEIEEMSLEELKQFAAEQKARADASEKLVAKAIDKDLATMLDELEEGDKEIIQMHLEEIERAGAGSLEKAVYWLEDAAGRRVIAAGKLGAVGYAAYRAGKVIYRAGSAGVKFIRGNPVEAAADAAGAFDEIAG